jgi:hypothetical protein
LEKIWDIQKDLKNPVECLEKNLGHPVLYSEPNRPGEIRPLALECLGEERTIPYFFTTSPFVRQNEAGRRLFAPI